MADVINRIGQTASPGEEVAWTRVITPHRRWLSLPIGEIWAYRDLLALLVRRDFVALYKQTILGPLWFVIQPLLTTVVFTLVFGNIAKISTNGAPHVAFYLAGITLWTYFSDSLTKTADTFTTNASIFGKVYFPRVIVPISIIVSNVIKFGVQFAIFLVVIGWYWAFGEKVHPNIMVMLLPFLLLVMAMLGLGAGLLISALTTKYRDLKFLVTFAVQLLMYATAIIYHVSALPKKYATLIEANPITPVAEAFRYGFLGSGSVDAGQLAYSFTAAAVVLALGMVVFNQVEQTFMDAV